MEEERPKAQEVAVLVGDDSSSCRAVVPQYKYASFGGTLSVLQEYYTISDSEIEGYERWSWTDGTKTCTGRDKITGIPGKAYCEDDVFTDPYDEIPKGPVPEGVWQLNAETFSLKGRECGGMDYKIGDVTKSSLIINRGYDEQGRRSDSMYEILFKCSTDAGLVDWVDDGKLTRYPGGNMSLEVRRTPMGEDMFMDEEEKRARRKEEEEEEEGDYEVYSIMFCITEGAEQGYVICDGQSSWEYRADGKRCRGKDTLGGKWGGCTPDMKTIDDVEPEIDLDDLDEDWENDREEDEEGGRQGRGSTRFGMREEEEDDEQETSMVKQASGKGQRGGGGRQSDWDQDQARQDNVKGGGSGSWKEHLKSSAGKSNKARQEQDAEKRFPDPNAWGAQGEGKGARGGGRNRNAASMPAALDEEEQISPEGYPIRDYQAPRTSYLAMLLVGIPVGTLLAGLSFIAFRRWQHRVNGPGPEYARVANRGDGDL